MKPPLVSDLPSMVQWETMAHSWGLSGPPLRPSRIDVAEYQRIVDAWIEQNGPPRVLLLGVTPELYRLRWPTGYDFLAVDRTRGMIINVWPGKPNEVLANDWLKFSLSPASRDIVLCDGGLHLLDHKSSQPNLVKRLYKVLTPGGVCIFRLFVPPLRAESPACVLEELLAGEIPNLNFLKMRLAMAMQRSPSEGVPVRSVWKALRKVSGNWTTLALRLGWPIEKLQTIDSYRKSDARYHFISQAEAVELFQENGFTFQGGKKPHYLLGERCPIVVFRRP